MGHASWREYIYIDQQWWGSSTAQNYHEWCSKLMGHTLLCNSNQAANWQCARHSSILVPVHRKIQAGSQTSHMFTSQRYKKRKCTNKPRLQHKTIIRGIERRKPLVRLKAMDNQMRGSEKKISGIYSKWTSERFSLSEHQNNYTEESLTLESALKSFWILVCMPTVQGASTAIFWIVCMLLTPLLEQLLSVCFDRLRV